MGKGRGSSLRGALEAIGRLPWAVAPALLLVTIALAAATGTASASAAGGATEGLAAGNPLGGVPLISAVDDSGAASTRDELRVRVILSTVPDGELHVFDAAVGWERLATVAEGEAHVDIAVEEGRAYRLVATTSRTPSVATAEQRAEFADACGVDARVDLSTLADGLYRAQFDMPEQLGCSWGGTAGPLSITATSVVTNVTCADADKLSWSSFAGFYDHMAYTDPATGKERRANALRAARQDGYEATVYRVGCSGLRPGTSYTVDFHAVYVIGGAEVRSAPAGVKVSTAPMSAPAPSSVRMGADEARVTVKVPATIRAKGAFEVCVYTGGKLAKTMTTTGAAQLTFTRKAKGAGKARYKAVYAWTGGAGVSKDSKAVRPRANAATFTRSRDASSYGYSKTLCEPLRVSYGKGGCLTARVLRVNTSLASASAILKAKVTVRVGDEKVASGAFKARVGRMAAKQATLSLKNAKRGCDLVNGGLRWTAKVTKGQG